MAEDAPQVPAKVAPLVGQNDPSYWFEFLHTEFDKESDRACVILAASLLDNALETLLKTRLVPVPGASDSLLEGAYAPLSSFSARIDIAFRLGLISSRFTRDLHLIRKIRNEFAHNISGCSFTDSSVRSRVVELARSAKNSITEPSQRTMFPEGPKGDFHIAVAWMQWNLRHLSNEVQPIDAANLEWGYQPR